MKHLRLFEEFNINIYEHGRCELFAYVLGETMGYDVYFHVDDEGEIEIDDDYITDMVLIHAYCKDKNGIMYDATGIINYSDLEDHSDWINSPRDIKIDSKIFQDFINDGFIMDYTDNEYNEIKNYILKNKTMYETP